MQSVVVLNARSGRCCSGTGRPDYYENGGESPGQSHFNEMSLCVWPPPDGGEGGHRKVTSMATTRGRASHSRKSRQRSSPGSC